MENKPVSGSYDSPPQFAPPKPASGSSTGWVIAIVLIAVLIFGACPCIGIGVALVLPAVQAAREAARAMESTNNLKQIGLAMHNYHTVHGTFPPAYIPDENGRPMTSWRTLILPYLEQSALYDQYDPLKPWDDPVNGMARETEVPIYRSPRETPINRGMTNYVAVTGEGTILTGDEPISMDQIRDGTSHTIMIVEILNSDIPWTEPRDMDVAQYQRVDDGADPSTTNVMPRRAAMLYADGSVRILDENVTREMLQMNFTRAGGEVSPAW